MRGFGFKFPVCFSRRSALALFFALAGTASVSGQSAFTWKYESRSLGAADRYGYAVWHVPLASLSLNGTNIPLRAEFTTDPRPEPSPSPLGKGWSVNLFASALVEVDQDSIRWHRPDGRIFYFILERGNASTKKPNLDALIVFKSKDDSWLALKAPKKRFVTLRHQESGAELVYEEGLLTRFTFAKSTIGTDQYLISYNRFRRPTRLTLQGTGKIIAEFVYDNANRAKELRIGDAGDPLAKVISFEYAEASLNKFPTGPYLTRLSDAALTPLAISYTQQGGDANRIQFQRPSITETNYLIWDAASGFIRNDESSTYKIENSSLANAGRPSPYPSKKLAEPDERQRTQSQVADYNWQPDEAKVTRTDNGGKSEYKFYDRSKGVAINIKSDGTKTITHYLLTPGAMHGKVRKIEVIKNGLTITKVRNGYDEFGRLIRKIDENGIISLWTYSQDGSEIRKFVGGELVEERKLANGRLIEKNWLVNGQSRRLLINYNGTQKTMIHYEGDIIKWSKLYRDGNLISTTFPNGQ